MILTAWCGALFFYGLDAGPLYRTESLRAIIGAEALRGNFLYPVLYGEPFLTKPPGHYAAIALCSAPFGEVTAATARLPSAFAASITVFLVYYLFRRDLGERPALLAAVLLPTSVLWLDKAPSAEIDMTLVAWVTASLVCLHRSLSDNGLSLGWLVAALVCVAGGTLTKWTAPAFFYLTAVPLLAWRGQLRHLFGWRHVAALGVAFGVCAAWALAVAHQVGWESLADTVRKEAAYRFNPPPKAKGYPWHGVVTFPLLVLAAHLPLAGFALLTLRRNVVEQFDARGKQLLMLLHCWTWPNLLFWAIVPNHNVRYALPMSPGLMGLGVMGLIGICRLRRCTAVQRRKRQIQVGGCLVLWLAAKVAFTEIVIPGRTAGRNAPATAAHLRELVPAHHPLYLCKLKDEGVMFYYARPARKLRDPADLPPGSFAVLIAQEWESRAAFGDLELVQWMYDQQGDPLILVRKP